MTKAKKQGEELSKVKTDNLKEDLHKDSFKRLVAIDFDGVMHQYSLGWKGPAVIYDPPVPGAIPWLRELIVDQRFEPVIYSSRSKFPEGVTAMKAWHLQYGLSESELGQLGFPTEKPAAWLTVDDRCFLFRGQFPTKDYMLNFIGWTKRPELVRQANGEDATDADFLRWVAGEVTGLVNRPEHLARLTRIANEIDGRA